MSRFIDFLFSAAGLVTVMLIAALWLWRRPGARAGRVFLASAALAYLLASTYAVPTVFTWALTRGYEPFAASDVPRGVTAVVVLGAGAGRIRGWNGGVRSVLTENGEARVLEAARVYSLAHPSWIISSGGVTGGADAKPAGLLMKSALVGLGVPESRILTEARALDTHEESRLTAPLLKSLGVDSVVLVTSALHMRRALGAFRAQGWTALPAVAPDPHFEDPWPFWIRPTDHGLAFSSRVAHEILGIPYYALRGWWRF